MMRDNEPTNPTEPACESGHDYAPTFQRSRLAGTLHRTCARCGAVTLDPPPCGICGGEDCYCNWRDDIAPTGDGPEHAGRWMVAGETCATFTDGYGIWHARIPARLADEGLAAEVATELVGRELTERGADIDTSPVVMVPALDPDPGHYVEVPMDDMMRGFVNAALWSEPADVRVADDGEVVYLEPDSDDFGATWDDLDFGFHEVASASLYRVAEVLADMVRGDAELFAKYRELTGSGWDVIGGDVYFSCAGHGTGLWDRGAGEVGDSLHRSVKGYGEVNTHYHENEVVIGW